MKTRMICLGMAMTALSGCATQKHVAQDYQRDSIRVEVRDSIIYRDTTIYVALEAENSQAVLPDTDTSRLATRYAESEAYVNKGKLHHSIRNKSEAIMPIELKMPTRLRQENEYLIRDRKVVEVVEVEKQLSRWQRFMMALGYGVLGAVAVWIAIKISKMIR